jgi:hypothetical protein
MMYCRASGFDKEVHSCPLASIASMKCFADWWSGKLSCSASPSLAEGREMTQGFVNLIPFAEMDTVSPVSVSLAKAFLGCLEWSGITPRCALRKSSCPAISLTRPE